MEQQKLPKGFGARGWMLMLYQFFGYLAFTAFTNYPQNVIYGGNSTVTAVYTVSTLVGLVAQFVISARIGKMKNVHGFGLVIGAIALILAVPMSLIADANKTPTVLWLIIYGLEVFTVVLWSTFMIGVIIGQWFPRKKGIVMGLVTFMFPIANGFLSTFAAWRGQWGSITLAFVPFWGLSVIGWLIGAIFVKDFPEMVGAYRDNDRSFTPEVARKMMETDIENKKTSVWTTGKTLGTGDFWLLAIPAGLLLAFSVGMMTQTMSVLGSQEFTAKNFTLVQWCICGAGILGSYILGIIDQKIGTKKSMIIACCVMVVAGILGSFDNGVMLFIAMLLLAVFMGASSNYTVSLAAQYWRREDFANVFSCVNPIANVIQAVGPFIITMLMVPRVNGVGMNITGDFIAVAVAGVIGVIFCALFSGKRVAKRDNMLREKAGKPVDGELENRL